MSDEFTNFRFLVTLNPADAYLPFTQTLLLLQFLGGGFQEVKGLGAVSRLCLTQKEERPTSCISCQCVIPGRASRCVAA